MYIYVYIITKTNCLYTNLIVSYEKHETLIIKLEERQFHWIIMEKKGYLFFFFYTSVHK